jgi:hypothetical protein
MEDSPNYSRSEYFEAERTLTQSDSDVDKLGLLMIVSPQKGVYLLTGQGMNCINKLCMDDDLTKRNTMVWAKVHADLPRRRSSRVDDGE